MVCEHHPKIRPMEKLVPPAYFSFWRWPFRKQVSSVLSCRIAQLCSSAVTPNGAKIAVVTSGKRPGLRVFSLPDARSLADTPISIGGTGGALAWSPDGKLLGSVQEEKTVIYRSDNLSYVAEFRLPYASDIAWSPGMNFVVLADWQTGLVVPTDWSSATRRTTTRGKAKGS